MINRDIKETAIAEAAKAARLPDRQPEISAAFEQLDGCVAMVDEVVHSLAARIGSLMRQPSQSPDTEKRAEAETGFGEAILVLTARLDNTIETCRDMLDRLEI